MDFGQRRTSDDQLEQASRTVLRWVLGTGFLWLHVGVYLVSVVALLLWNFARTPNDVWVDDPLRTWGLVVVFHITAVAAGTTAWRLMRLGEAPPSRSRTTAQTRATTPGRSVTGASSSTPATHASPSFPAATNGTYDPSAERTAHIQIAPTSNGGAETPTTRPGIGSATEWGTLFVRRAREMMSTARDQMSPTQQARATKLTGELNGVSVPAQPDPSKTWPTTPSAPPATTWPTTASTNGHHVPNDANGAHRNGHLHGGQNGSSAPGVIPVPQIKTASPAATDSESTATEDARWSWVESAASAWMAHRERDEAPERAKDAPPPPSTDDATTAP